MKAFRFVGHLDDDPPQVTVAWEHGCQGVVQDGSEIVAYFDAEVALPVEGTWESVDEVDYLAEYFAGLAPVAAGPLVVAPTHAPVTLAAGQKPLWLDPGMAFGTGHHETTKLILLGLGRRRMTGLRVLDVGSGSGILAIAADLLGAAVALGIDNDPATIDVARANAELNRSRAEFRLGTLDDVSDGATADSGRERGASWDVLVANLFAELHAQLMRDYVRVTEPGATLLLSGIVEDKLEEVLAAIPPELELTHRESDGPWHLLELSRA